jgi:hypothetical protein
MIRSMIRSTINNEQWYRSMAAGQVTVFSDYELIRTELITSNTATVVFSSLGDYASIYKHLQLRATVRTNRADTLDDLSLRFNNDSTALAYSLRLMQGNGSNVSLGGAEGQTRILVSYVPAANNTADTFGAIIADFIDPFSTTKNKNMRSLGGQFDASHRIIGEFSGAWYNTTAISSINLYSNGNFVAGSRFSLYGIRS